MMSSKSELTKTIDTQQQRIVRLEQRFADVVAAYKNLQKEKDALESTVRILSSTSNTESSSNANSASPKEVDESGSEVESTNAPSEQQTFQEKLQGLQQNMAVITEQKNRMEHMFQSDKRKLKTENDELKNSLEEAKAENIILKEKSDNDIKELKKQLRQSQREHERETADHGVSLRELQTLLSAERNKSESFEHQLDECRAKVVTLESRLEAMKRQNTTLNSQYQSKLNDTREKDLIDLEELKRSKEKITELTSKLKDLETEHVDQLRLESTRNQQLEKRLAELANENAQRVSGTETHIAELSEQIGLIEKQRAQDQMSIQRLKERMAQLDVENSLLTKATATSIEQESASLDPDEENHQDLETLMKYISKLKVSIRVANDRFGKSLSIEDILNLDRSMSTDTKSISENNHLLHSKCREEIDRLKGELEKYRSKTMAAFKIKAFKDTNVTQEIDDLRNQNDQLREKLLSSQSLYNAENERHNQVVAKLQTSLNDIREQHRHELDQFAARKRAELNELECELEKQRERTVRLLAEKDRELEAMKKHWESSSGPTFPAPLVQPDEKPSSESTIMSELFPRARHHSSSSTIGGPGTPANVENNNILFFIQEQQLREQEMISLRKQRHELELTLRDVHKKYSYEINQLQVDIEHLKDDLEHRLLSEQRNQALTKNEHNIDYLKNVFYHYLLASDLQVKHTMANALMTILHFSSKEKAKIESVKGTASLTNGGWFSKA